MRLSSLLAQITALAATGENHIVQRMGALIQTCVSRPEMKNSALNYSSRGRKELVNSHGKQSYTHYKRS